MTWLNILYYRAGNKNNFLIKLILFFFLITYNTTLILAMPHYFGNLGYYLFLGGLINLILSYSFLISNYFFNIFFSIFILMGFGFKFTLSLIFHSKDMAYVFINPFFSEGGTLRTLSQYLLNKSGCTKSYLNHDFQSVYNSGSTCYDITNIIYNGDIYDRGIMVSCVGLSVFLFSMFFFRWLTNEKISNKNSYMLKTSFLYEKYRLVIFLALGISIILVGLFNFSFNIYQRGLVSNSDFLLYKPIIAFMLLFGFSSFISLLLFSEYIRRTKGFIFLLTVSLLEPFISYTSMISRGFIFNAMSLFFATLKLIKTNIVLYLILLLFGILSLFSLSIYLTENNRLNKFNNNNNTEVDNLEVIKDKPLNHAKTKMLQNLNIKQKGYKSYEGVWNSLYQRANPGEAGTLSLDGILRNGNNLNAVVTIFSLGDETGNTFNVTGTNLAGASVTESIKGPNKGTRISGSTIFKTISSITTTVKASGDIQIGTHERQNKTLFFNVAIPTSKFNFISSVLIERWVGLEEVIMVANHKQIGWAFFKNAFLERQNNNQASLFDREIYKGYLFIDRNKHNFTSIPGIIAFLYYSNSYIFLCISLFTIIMFCLGIEFILRKVSFENIFISSLIGQIIAYRLVHFGVYPIETYKFLLSVFFIILISFIYSKLFLKELL